MRFGGICALALVGCVSWAVASNAPPQRQLTSANGSRPNLIVITTDDQTVDQFEPRVMPFTTRFFRKRGVTFENSIATPPLCCPSRATFLTGQYAHNHGVVTNDNGYSLLRDNENVLPAWLARAGYRTALVGKYLNGYPALSGTAAPGWTDFVASGDAITYTDFQMSDNGQLRSYDEGEYSTDVITDSARDLIEDSADGDQPLFMWVTYNAPHTVPDGEKPCGGVRAQPRTPEDFEAFTDVHLPSSAAREESDLGDKGRWVQQKGRVAEDTTALTKSWQCALAALTPVDEAMKELVTDLRRLGELDETVIVYTSDNGFFYGEHGIPDDKQLPYDPALRVPLAVAAPAASAGRSESLVSNADLAPTLLDFAKAEPCIAPDECRTVDGRSLRPLLTGRKPDWAEGRAIPVELDADFEYDGFRTVNELFMSLRSDRIGELSSPHLELYDLERDPDELENVLAENRPRARRLAGVYAARAERLASCMGVDGPNACP